MRKYKKLEIKVRRVELNVVFLKNCQTINILSKFLITNVPNVGSKDLQLIKKRLLRSAFNKRNKELTSLMRDLRNYEQEIGRVLSSTDNFILGNVVKKSVDRMNKITMKTHEKKLRNLTKSISLPFTTAKSAQSLPLKLLTTDDLEILKYALSTHCQ